MLHQAIRLGLRALPGLRGEVDANQAIIHLMEDTQHERARERQEKAARLQRQLAELSDDEDKHLCREQFAARQKAEEEAAGPAGRGATRTRT